MLDQNHHFLPISPDEAGVDPAGILAFLDHNAQRDLHGMLLIRSGKAAVNGFWKPYEATDKRHVFSVSKSFTATAVGIAVDEGLLSVHDKVISFFKELCPDSPCENLRQMEVRDLLRMGTGNDVDTLPAIVRHPGEDWVKTFLHRPVEHAPGSKFVYNSGASYMLSAIISKVTGQSVLAYLKPRLFEPLGIKDVAWDCSPQGICDGGWGIHVSAEDIAKLGLTYLRQGVFEGKRILSEEWVREATSIQIDNAPSNTATDWKQGYGYQIWRCQHGCFRFDGAYGQYMVAFPQKDAVLVILSRVDQMQDILDDVWEYILPALHDAPLTGRETEIHTLKTRLKTLSCPLPEGNGRETTDSYLCGPNPLSLETLSLKTNSKGGVLTFQMDGATCELSFGTDAFLFSKLEQFPIFPNIFSLGLGERFDCLVGTAGCFQKDTLHLRVIYKGTPHRIDCTLQLGDAPSFSFRYPFADLTGNAHETTIMLTKVC